MGRIVGIDLGTTYSCVAIFNEKKGIFEVLPNKAGGQTTPSVAAVNRNGEVVVGEAAKRQYALDPESTVVEIKRHMGELGADGKSYAVRFAGRDHSPEEVSAYILRELREGAERALGEPVTGAVITVPAYFEEPQRQATMRAGKLAGLDVKRIMNEPTAAAVAYGHDRTEDEDEDEEAPSKPIRLLIYDLGGGTFDVSVIEVSQGQVRVKSTHGDHYLGGVDFDRRIVEYCLAHIKSRHGIDLEAMSREAGKPGERGRKAMARLKSDAEGFKKELSSQETVAMQFPMLVQGRDGEPIDVELDLTRAQFEQMVGPKLNDTLKSVDYALNDAKLRPQEIDEVILVGGSTRIPLVKRLLEKHFGKAPRTDIHPDLCVALGAAHEALKHVDLTTVAPESRAVVEAKKEQLDAVVDVTGHSLGVAVRDAGPDLGMSVLIPRQTPIPVAITHSYSPAADYQTTVNIQVYQGEDRWVRNNTHLREFTLEGLPALPRGQLKIDVTFMLDANGVLTVTAKDTMTGRQVEVEIRDERLKAGSTVGLLPGAAGPAGGSSAGGGGMPYPGPSQPSYPPSQPSYPPSGGMASAPVVTTTTPTGAVPEKFRKVLEQAQQMVPRLPQPKSQQLQGAVEALLGSVRSGNEALIEMCGNALTDTLFDLQS